LKTERVHDVIDLLCAILDAILRLLCGRIGSDILKIRQLPALLAKVYGLLSLTNFHGTKGNHGAIDFINNTIDLLHVVAVRHELIA